MTVPDAAPLLHAFLLADPAAHSLSPRMHAAAFHAAGLNGTYGARRVPASDLGAALAALRAPGVLGANLSLPHKETALALLDTLSPAARAIGAVNTVVHRNGELLGDNTDAPGLMAALDDAGFDWTPGAQAVVLGAGGAARAAVYAALRLGEARVWVVNRTPARAQALTRAFPAPDRPVVAAPAADVPWPEISLVINASSAGLDAPDQTPLDAACLAGLPPGALVYDMVYRPLDTRLLREARALGLRAENGLGMLAHQARLAFGLWTGVTVPVEVFLGALDAGAQP
ncbi:shikimate dehydrogenase [Deinococcus arcticus]|uniref:shikimate dehydrogenase n=1 Tax=Deinococcus arcticus TaxID=2136176 RepID=UPI001E40EADF|nr:shikimate dehydrogenase [Deinococcus arcticus]